MARPLRIEYEGAVYHVTSRGNGRQNIYVDDDDRRTFLEGLRDVVERFNWICHGYCLMSNHYHLLIETPNANLSRGMRHLNGVYTQNFNRRHGRVGHVLQGRFKSILVEKESHLLELARYVVLNPVRAKMVRSARDWPWSSYCATVNQQEPLSFLTTDWILSQFSDDHRRAIDLYREFVKQGRGVGVWDKLRGGVLMGSDGFVEGIAPLLRDSALQREIPQRERLVSRPSLDELFAEWETKAMRNEKIYEATRIHEYTLSELQEHLGLHYSTISRIASRVKAKKRSKDKI
jgi:REP element-mobilizing transposase RayT